MRIRRKPWARPELEACPYYIADPAAHRNQWRGLFSVSDRPLHVELGCGKGTFIAQLALSEPAVNFIAVDIKSEVLAMTRRNIEAAYENAGRRPDNVLLLSHDIARIALIFGKEDAVNALYINFPNPWPKDSHQKRRLTHPRQLEQYRDFLTPGAAIRFKTDDSALYYDTLMYFTRAGFAVDSHTQSLAPYADRLPVSEHEQMFRERGCPIHQITARV